MTRPGDCARKRQTKPPWPRLLFGLVFLGMVMQCCGCAGLRGLAWRRNEGPFGANTPCSLSKTPTAEEVVAHVNRNVEKIQGWRCSSVKIRAQSVPVPLSGNLVVERDRRLRLEVTSVAGKEVDLGSNDDVFWLWMRPRGQQPPAVYYAAHEDMDIARRNLPVPFEPEWLMEALGVTPLSSEAVQLDGEPGVAAIKLVSEHQMADGQLVKKVIVVHACHGYVMEHSTYDHRGQPLVRALLQDYRLDPESGAVLPRHVKLDWPQAEMSLAMDMGHVEVNPQAIPAAVWNMPQVPGSAMVNLGDPRIQGGQQYATRPHRNETRPADPEFPPDAPAFQNSARPTVLATNDEEVESFLPPRTNHRSISRAADFPEDDFEPPRVKWQSPSPEEFEPPAISEALPIPETDDSEPPGQASVDLLPAIEPF